jgi:hypothetical protein
LFKHARCCRPSFRAQFRALCRSGTPGQPRRHRLVSAASRLRTLDASPAPVDLPCRSSACSLSRWGRHAPLATALSSAVLSLRAAPVRLVGRVLCHALAANPDQHTVRDSVRASQCKPSARLSVRDSVRASQCKPSARLSVRDSVRASQCKPSARLFASASAPVDIKHLRNIGISAHIDSGELSAPRRLRYSCRRQLATLAGFRVRVLWAGKTTLTERILFYTGADRSLPSHRTEPSLANSFGVVPRRSPPD